MSESLVQSEMFDMQINKIKSWEGGHLKIRSQFQWCNSELYMLKLAFSTKEMSTVKTVWIRLRACEVFDQQLIIWYSFEFQGLA